MDQNARMRAGRAAKSYHPRPASPFFSAVDRPVLPLSFSLGTSDQRVRLRRDVGLTALRTKRPTILDRFCVFELPQRRFRGFWTDSSSCKQPSSNQKQVAERKQREELRTVFGQPTVAGLHMAELALENAERMLDLGAHHGDDPVDLLVDGVELAALGRLAHYTPDFAILGERGLSLSADITFVHCLAGHVYMPEKGPRPRPLRRARAHPIRGCHGLSPLSPRGCGPCRCPHRRRCAPSYRNTSRCPSSSRTSRGHVPWTGSLLRTEHR